MTSFHGPARLLVLATALLGLTLPDRGVQDWEHSLPAVAAPDSSNNREAQSTATEEEVRTRCTACHKLPPPDILPRAAWRDEIVRMMLIQEGVPEPAGASSVLPLSPDWLRLWRYYDARAPERLAEPEPWPAASPAPVPFEKIAVSSAAANGAVAISHVCLYDVDQDKRLDIVAGEMRTGPVMVGLAKDRYALKMIARLAHPAHIEPIDLDKDGLNDFLVADLGSFQPADHADGAVYWLRRRRDQSFVTVPIATRLPRTADARAADFDGDGDLDIVVGSFGWRFTGKVTLLENKTRDWKTPLFESRELDPRTGAIHVIPTDVNKDGKPDIVILFAQQHETVVAFINKGGGFEFEAKPIYEGPHPNWGSSGIELVDLDKDGDLDVLLAHGDSFDDLVIKPYHGLMWLENTGSFPFVERRLANLPGAHSAKGVDIDGRRRPRYRRDRAARRRRGERRAAVADLAGTDDARQVRAAHDRVEHTVACVAGRRRHGRRRQARHRPRLVRRQQRNGRVGRRLAERAKVRPPTAAVAAWVAMSVAPLQPRSRRAARREPYGTARR